MVRLSLALLLAACTPSDTDQAGNAYPALCKGDLSDVSADVTFMDRDILQAVNHTPGATEEGLWLANPAGRDVIWVDDSLRGWKRDDAVRHERCHSRMYHETGSGRWHR